MVRLDSEEQLRNGISSEAAGDASMEICEVPDSGWKHNPGQEGGLKASAWSAEQVRKTTIFPHLLGNLFSFPASHE